MKKYLLYLMAIVVIISTIGCGSAKFELTNEDYNLSDDTTSKGITIGSSSDDFVNAYHGFIVDVWYADDNSNTAKEIKVNEVDYTKQSHIGLHTFFIDDKAIDVNSSKYFSGFFFQSLIALKYDFQFLSNNRRVQFAGWLKHAL